MKKIKIVAVAIPILFCLTGCVTVEVPEDDTCFRYIDYKGEEHYMNYQTNNCFVSKGCMLCRDGETRKQVVEYEITKCPKEDK